VPEGVGERLDITLLTPNIGAEIRGVDLATELSDETIASIRSAWLEHLVVFFPDQELTPDAQVAFARRFGEITEGHPVEPSLPGHPNVLPIVRQVVVFDAADLAAESAFWSGMLGCRVLMDSRWHSVVDADGRWVVGVQLAPDRGRRTPGLCRPRGSPVLPRVGTSGRRRDPSVPAG
jgi:hypothetical protein